MKKILIPILCMVMSVASFANSVEEVCTYNYGNTTVTFIENSQFTAEEKEIIAERLAYGYTEDSSSTYSLCWLTGHNLTTEEVTTTEHKLRSTEPRCDKVIYDVSTCSKCDHYEQTEISRTENYCCPEE